MNIYTHTVGVSPHTWQGWALCHLINNNEVLRKLWPRRSLGSSGFSSLGDYKLYQMKLYKEGWGSVILNTHPSFLQEENLSSQLSLFTFLAPAAFNRYTYSSWCCSLDLSLPMPRACQVDLFYASKAWHKTFSVTSGTGRERKTVPDHRWTRG